MAELGKSFRELMSQQVLNVGHLNHVHVDTTATAGFEQQLARALGFDPTPDVTTKTGPVRADGSQVLSLTRRLTGEEIQALLNLRVRQEDLIDQLRAELTEMITDQGAYIHEGSWVVRVEDIAFIDKKAITVECVATQDETAWKLAFYSAAQVEPPADLLPRSDARPDQES